MKCRGGHLESLAGLEAKSSVTVKFNGATLKIKVRKWKDSFIKPDSVTLSPSSSLVTPFHVEVFIHVWFPYLECFPIT